MKKAKFNHNSDIIGDTLGVREELIRKISHEFYGNLRDFNVSHSQSIEMLLDKYRDEITETELMTIGFVILQSVKKTLEDERNKGKRFI